MNDVTVSIVDWPQRKVELIAIRRAVFVDEQCVPESIEMDGKDPSCYHALACDGTGRPVGTARLDKYGKIGRMAVLPEHRRSGVGTKILQAIMDCGRSHGITDFHLSAQIDAVEFYRKMGFEPSGDEFEEAGIRHINMRKA